jgi:hypothetical protein
MALPRNKSSRKKRLFSTDIVSIIDRERMLAIKAGTGDHRFIGIWAVVVKGRVFVRSWSIKPRSWYRTFREEPRGTIIVDGHEIATPGSIKYARDLGRAKSRATTTELVPL